MRHIRAAALACGASALTVASTTTSMCADPIPTPTPTSMSIPPPNAVASPPAGSKQLLKCQLVVRHGDRTPITSLARAHETPEIWQSHLMTAEDARILAARGRVVADVVFASQRRGEAWEGQLTRQGLTQMKTLGEHVIRDWLIKEHGIVSNGFDDAVANGEVKVRSTAVARTVASARAVLAGGWPTTEEEAMRGGISESSSREKQGLVIEVRVKEHESMFPKPGSACARLSAFFAESWAPEVGEGLRAFSEREGLTRLKDAITAERGKEAGVVMVWDPLQCRVNHGMELPSGVSAEDVAHLLTMMERRHFAAFANPQDARAKGLIGTQLLSEICAEMGESTSVKLSVYSGHDSTLMALFAALGMLGSSIQVWPKTGSCLIFETWRMEDGSMSVRAVYNGKPLMLTSNSRASDGVTSYEDFKSFVATRVPKDFVAACKL